MATWLDSVIGWDKDFVSITTYLPWDEAIDQDESDFEKYFEDNFSTEHLKIKPGAKPVDVKINLPTPAQWQSVIPLMHQVKDRGEEASAQAAYTFFEMCVRFPGEDKMKAVHRDGFKRLPEKVMDYLVSTEPVFVHVVGMWILNKYMLGEEEKKQ